MTTGLVQQSCIELIENENGKFWKVNNEFNMNVKLEKELVLNVERFEVGTRLLILIPAIFIP